MFRTLLSVVYQDGTTEAFDSLPCGTPNQALEVAFNLLFAALEDNDCSVMSMVGVTKLV